MKKIIAALTALLLLPVSASAAIDAAVICYHSATDDPLILNPFRISDDELESDLKYYIEQGYTFLLPKEMWYAKDGAKNIVLTFDDGYDDFYDVVFPLLKKYNAKAAVYIIGSEIDKTGYLSSEQIKELDASGIVEIGNHTTIMHTYSYPLSTLETNELVINEYIEDIKDCSRRISEITGHGTESFAYPSGRYTLRLDRIIRQNLGYTTTFTTDHGLVKNRSDITGPMKRIYRNHGDTPAGIAGEIEALK